MVEAAFIGSRRGPSNGEVPFKEIGIKRGGVQGGIWVGAEFVGFFEYAFDGGGFRVEGWE